MKPLLRVLSGLLLMSMATSSGHAALVLPGNAMKCVRSAALVNCVDRFGNHYGIVQQGHDTWMRGFDAISGQSWSQVSTQYGRLQLFTGVTSTGDIWFGSSRRIGWNVLSRVTNSSGQRERVTCNRLIGCN
jgi:hypothetical protein